MPVAIAAIHRQRRAGAVANLVESLDHLGHALRTRAQAQQVGAAALQGNVVGEQVARLARKGLDAVQGEQRRALLALQWNAFRIALAAEAAIVLRPVLRSCGEAARRIGQR
ncbi:hypothetical protein D9M68_913340 [compost metagenome]